MSKLRSYGKIYNLGHAAIRELLDGPVTIEEKVDGSQFSFGMRDGQLFCRSKGKALDLDAPEKMFDAAVLTAQHLAPSLVDGWTYRGEYLRSPKHNTLAYDRVPIRHIVLFDIDTGDQEYMSWERKAAIAGELGLEVVPRIVVDRIEGPEHIASLLERKSFLGGQQVEGLVFKNYERFGRDGKTLMGKHVSERFKEVHRGDWKKRHPVAQDIKQSLVQAFRTPARWDKAVQHLRDRGELTNTPADIGKLMTELVTDLREECAEEMAAMLLKWAWKGVARGVGRGFPEWYKAKLIEAQFEGEAAE